MLKGGWPMVIVLIVLFIAGCLWLAAKITVAGEAVTIPGMTTGEPISLLGIIGHWIGEFLQGVFSFLLPGSCSIGGG